MAHTWQYLIMCSISSCGKFQECHSLCNVQRMYKLFSTGPLCPDRAYAKPNVQQVDARHHNASL